MSSAKKMAWVCLTWSFAPHARPWLRVFCFTPRKSHRPEDAFRTGRPPLLDWEYGLEIVRLMSSEATPLSTLADATKALSRAYTIESRDRLVRTLLDVDPDPRR